jgi:hypothetical protein
MQERQGKQSRSGTVKYLSSTSSPVGKGVIQIKKSQKE